MRKIEFVNYDGSYPTLCSGTLTLKVDGVEMAVKCGLVSGGWVSFDENWDEHVQDGPWEVEFNDDFFTKEEQEYIVSLVNDNVEWGCCGGCV